MADENRELWRYELNITDVEAKMARLQQLGADLQARRGRGEDTSSLEEQLGKEAESFGALFIAKTKDADATQQVLRQKEKLAHVVRLLGGQFGGLLGPLGSAAELLFTMGPAMAGIAAGVAGVALLAAAWKSVADEVERAKKAQDEYNAARLEQLDKRLAEDTQITAGLEGFGARSPENINAVLQLRKDLMQVFGFGLEEATKGATAAVGGGVGDLDTATVLARIMARGIPVTSAAEVQKVLGIAQQTGDFERQLEAARRQLNDPVGQENRRIGRSLNTDAFSGTAVEAAFRDAGRRGLLVGENDIALEEFKLRMDTFEDRRRRAARLRDASRSDVIATVPGAGSTSTAGADTLERELSRDQLLYAIYQDMLQERAATRGPQPALTPAIPFDPEPYKPKTGRNAGAPSLEEAAAQMRAKHVGNGVVIHAQTIQMVGDARRASVDNRPRLTPAGLDDGGPF